MRKTTIKAIVALLLLAILAGFPPPAFGYPVPPLPEDNLIVNPWFRSSTEPGRAGADGWTILLVDGEGWGLSQKETNPSPDIVISGVCGNKEVYCGTGARWAKENVDGDVQAHPGVDAVMYQVVPANPAERKLKYFMHWVIHKVDVVEVTVYGSDAGPDGPWTEVWKPFIAYQDSNPPPGSAPGRGGVPWFTTPILDAVLERGYPHYKVELHARYPESGDGQGEVGVKVTGIYFATEFTEETTRLSTPHVSYNPTILPTYGPVGGTATPSQPDMAQDRTPTAVPNTAEPEITPTATATQLPAPSEENPAAAQVDTASPTPQIRPTRTDVPAPAIEENPENGGLGLGFLIGLITAALALGVFVLIRSLGRSSR